MQKEKLGLWSLVFMGLGNVIGAGVVTYIGVAVGHTGRSAWLAYLVAILLGFLVNLPVIFMTCAVRIKGGNYTCVSATMGDVLAGFYGISNLLQVFLFANFALGMGSYLTIVFPAIPAKAWGVIGLTLFMVINLLGLKTLSRFQNIMSVVLVGNLLAIGVYGVAHGLPDSLDIMQAGYFSGGSGGFYQAVMVLFMSTQGYIMIAALSDNCKNPTRDLPLANCIIPLVLVVIYGTVGFAMSNVLPIEETANQTLVAVVGYFFNPVVTTIFIFVGPVMALSSTMNAFFSLTERPMIAVTKDGWLPAPVAALNKHGIAWKFILVEYLLGLIPILMDLSIGTIVSNTTFLSSVGNIIVIIGTMLFPKRLEGAWENRTWKFPMWLFMGSCVLALAIRVFMMYQSILTANSSMLIGSVIGLVVILGWCFLRKKQGLVNVEKSWELK